MSLYAAIDLHSTNSVLAIVNEEGQAVFQRRYPNELAKIVQALAPYQPQLDSVAVESTYNWYWLVDGLMDHDFGVRLVHTTAVPQYSGLKHGDDVTDALHLAQLMRLGILPEAFIYPRALRPCRDLLRRRASLVHQAVQLLLSIQSTYARHTGQCLSSDAVRHGSVEALQAAFPDPTVCYGVLTQYQHWSALQEDIQAMEEWVMHDVADAATLARLRSVSGIGPVLGLTIQLETGPIERFQSVGDYASYCRMVESKRLTNGKCKGHGNRKSGNRYLCWAYIEAAHHAIRWSEPVRRWYTRKASRKPNVVAVKAVAHKLARACYHMMREHTPFEVARAFG